MNEARDQDTTPRQCTARGSTRPRRGNALTPPEPQTIRMQLTALMLSCDRLTSLSTIKSQLRQSYQLLASTMGDKEAQELWRHAAKGPSHRPPVRRNALIPSKSDVIQAQLTALMLSCDRYVAYLPPASQLLHSYQLVAFTMGEKEAQRLWKEVAKRPSHRPLGSWRPKQDQELLNLIDAAISRPNPVPIGQIARAIHDAWPDDFGPSAKSIEMRIKRLKTDSRRKS
jgi:hypothetical protein